VGATCGAPTRLTYSTRPIPGRHAGRGMTMLRSKLVSLLALGLYVAGSTSTYTNAATPWQFPASLTNVVASSPTTGGGYPVPAGARGPVAGTCGPGPFNPNHCAARSAVDQWA